MSEKTTETQKKSLLSCPFCGGEAKLEQTGRNKLTIKCKGCMVRKTQKVLHRSLKWLEEKMIKDWNTRATILERKDDCMSEDNEDQKVILPVIGGSKVERSLNFLKQSAKICIAEEQKKIHPDNGLIAVLCDTVRLAREQEDRMADNMAVLKEKLT